MRQTDNQDATPKPRPADQVERLLAALAVRLVLDRRSRDEERTTH